MPYGCIMTIEPLLLPKEWLTIHGKRVWTTHQGMGGIKKSLKFVPKGPINNIQALVKIMAWRRLGDKPSSEPMVNRLIYVSLRQNELEI